MATLSEVKKHIRTVRATNQVANAMRTIAVSKYNRTLDRWASLRAYREALHTIGAELGSQDRSLCADPLREIRHVTYVFITASRGLCGSYNMELIRYIESLLSEETAEYSVILCGKWGETHAKFPCKAFPVSDIPLPAETDRLTEYLTAQYRSGKTDRVVFVYQDYINVLTHVCTARQFLPLSSGSDVRPEDWLYMPSQKELEQTVVLCSLQTEVYANLLSAAASAHSATMTAMRTAADNSQDMMADLEKQLNKMRQNSVTTELLDIVSGSTNQ